MYNFVAAAFDASPEQLGYLTLARALVQAAASPLGGILGGFLVILQGWMDSWTWLDWPPVSDWLGFGIQQCSGVSPWSRLT